ncbi:MAG: squalene/phytoene synthase family protein [Candidatus Eisenbacteria bacterium]|uniref:Squalene/phytoene synthase family protein n=1 Tax=Eiseniibacteriota bacterium TaxID=2212470 RepID=A0A948RVE1_UNCEI|nr:squalene/phytoene synthase family protein [Candidatus Eisenbacteria bacterium]MBU2690404.1 squalene/phytoene synthase family protein [Candidatus Eisenbacteria bacterium]
MSDLKFCKRMLPRVSRTFAMAIRVLPPALGRPVLLAYLLCRIADTIEDDTSIPAPLRVEALKQYADAVEALCGSWDPEVSALLDEKLRALASQSRFVEADEETRQSWSLAVESARVILSVNRLPSEQKKLIAGCVGEMSRGMAATISREVMVIDPAMPVVCRPLIGALDNENELVQYADCVAGTVGRFLQQLFCAQLGLTDGDRRRGLERTAFHFSLGLQYTNIVQDIVADRARGWSYVPRSLASFHGLAVECLLDPAARESSLEIVKDLIRKSLDHLEGALEFTLLIPRSAPRIRLFCLWPLFLALSTLKRAWDNPEVLEAKVKIGRGEVRRLLRATSLRCLGEGALRQLYRRESLWAPTQP